MDGVSNQRWVAAREPTVLDETPAELSRISWQLEIKAKVLI